MKLFADLSRLKSKYYKMGGYYEIFRKIPEKKKYKK